MTAASLRDCALLHTVHGGAAAMLSRLHGFKQNWPPTLAIPRLAALVFASTLPHAAHAQAGAACVQGGSMAETNACAIQVFQAADTQHQILYGDVMLALSAHERPALRKEQSAWTRQRITQCKQATQAFEAHSDWPSRYHGCLVEHIQARNVVLKHWLHHGAPP